MSLDNISHLRQTGLDELVPSRYAVQVGDIEVLVISDGVLPITASTLATTTPPADLAEWLNDNFLPPEIVDWPLNVVVVRSGDQTILVDAGLGLEFPDFPRAGQTIQRLEAAGVDHRVEALEVVEGEIVHVSFPDRVVPFFVVFPRGRRN